MKVLIDATILRMDKLFASVPIYIFRLLSAINYKDRGHFTLLIEKSMAGYIHKNYPGYNLLYFKGRGYKLFYWRNPLYYWYNYRYSQIVRKHRFDVVFNPTDIPIYNTSKLSCPKVVVCHDLKALKGDASLLTNALIRWEHANRYRKSFQSADAIVAISKFTRQDILTYYPDVERKIHVIYNAVKLSNEAIIPQNLDLSFSYILYVNTLQPYKNIVTLVKAFCSIKDKCKEKLLIVGKSTAHWENVILPLLRKNQADNKIIRLENLSNNELRYLYEHASLFVTPSLNEGFGYTPIEAAICKCPVLSSIQESLPDVTKGMTNYYYPATDEKALAHSMIELLNNPPSQEKLYEIADTYSECYSTKKQVKEILQLLKDVVQQNRFQSSKSIGIKEDTL